MVKSITSNKIVNIFAPIAETFYSTLRPFALFSKVLGLFPLQNALSADGRDLVHRWLSLATLWGPVLHLSTNALYFHLETSAWWRFQFPYVNLPRAILISVASLVEDRHLTELITGIEEFDVKYKRISCNRANCYWRTHLGVVWTLVSVASIVFFVVPEMLFERPEGFWMPFVTAVSSQVNVVPRMLYLNMFMLFCQSLAWRFGDVRALWKVTLEGIGAEHDQFLGRRYEAGTRLENVRILHHELAMAVKVLNKCYGMRLAIYFAIVLAEILQDLYVALYMERTSNNAIQILFTAYNVVVLVSVTHSAGKLAEEENAIQDELGGCRVSSLPSECIQQLQLFATCRPEVRVSAAGFCHVDRSVLVSMLVAISTYWIVVIQFDSQLHEITAGYQV